MKTRVFNNKIIVHIPHFKWEDNQLIPVKFGEQENCLEEKLKMTGAESFYISPAIGYYQGRHFEEDLLTIFSQLSETKMIEQTIIETFEKCNDFMCQESYGYELNGALYVLTVDP